MDAGPRIIFATSCLWAVLSAGAPGVAAQTMYKCRDGRGQVTYSNISCEKQGLKDAGAIADRTTTLPMGPAQKAPPPGGDAKAAPPKVDSEIGPMPAPAQVKPVSPLIEKLLK